MKAYYPLLLKTAYWTPTTHYVAAYPTNTNFTTCTGLVAYPRTPTYTQEYAYAATPAFTTNYRPSPSTNAYSGTTYFDNAAARYTSATATSDYHICQQKTNNPKQPTLLSCKMCKIRCSSSQDFQSHINGKKHKKNEAANTANQSVVDGKSLCWELCNENCRKDSCCASYIQGTKHTKEAKFHPKLGKPSVEPVLVTKLSTSAVLAPIPDIQESPKTVNKEREEDREYEVKRCKDYAATDMTKIDKPKTSVTSSMKPETKQLDEGESLLLDANSKEEVIQWGMSKVMGSTLENLQNNDDIDVSERSNSRKMSGEKSQHPLISSLESDETKKMAASCGRGGGGGMKRKSDNDCEDISLVVKKVRRASDAKSEESPLKSPTKTMSKMSKQLTKKDLKEFIAKKIVAVLSNEHRNEIAELNARIVKLEKAKDYWKRQATVLHEQHVQNDLAIQRLSQSLIRPGTLPPTKTDTRSVGLQVPQQTQVPSLALADVKKSPPTVTTLRGTTNTTTTPTPSPPSTMKFKSSLTSTPKPDVRVLTVNKSPQAQDSKVVVVMDDRKISARNVNKMKITRHSQPNTRTLSVTLAALSMFRRFMASVGEKRELVDLTPTDLGRHLTNFFANAKKIDGSEYGAHTLAYVFDSIDRHLRSNNYSVSIKRDETFYNAREQLRQKRRELQRKKKSTVNSTKLKKKYYKT